MPQIWVSTHEQLFLVDVLSVYETDKQVETELRRILLEKFSRNQQ